MAAIDPAHFPRRPGLAFLLSHPAHLIALGLGTGLLRPAPGTWGTAAGWLIFVALSQLRPSLAALALSGAGGVAGGDLGGAARGCRAGRAGRRPDRDRRSRRVLLGSRPFAAQPFAVAAAI